jgi:hypothetical protein
MKPRRRVYLSGGMEYAVNEGSDWRSSLHTWLEQQLGLGVFNPNLESEKYFNSRYPSVNIRSLKSLDTVRFQQIVADLVDLDCHEIAERSDFVICYWDEAAMRGAGTKGELTIAKFFRKPVYLVTSMPPCEIPGWVLGCTTRMFSSFDELKTYLLQR